MSIAEEIIGLLVSLPEAAARMSDAERARLDAALARARSTLATIQPNAPGIRAAIEERRAGEEPTKRVRTSSSQTMPAVKAATAAAEHAERGAAIPGPRDPADG